MNKVISLFALPTEIDELEHCLIHLKRCFNHVNEDNYTVDFTVCISDEMVDWGSSVLTKEFFIDKVESLNNLGDNFKGKTSTDIIGVVDQRRYAWKKYQQATHFIWFDPDIVFPDQILFYIENAIEVAEKIDPLHVISPEIVRIWDDTWDCLVNSEFLSKDHKYYKNNNPYKDCTIRGDVFISQVINNVYTQPPMKFGGGLFTCLSKSILDLVTIPDTLGPYGLEDTLIMAACNNLGKGIQLKLNNIIVGENYKHKTTAYLKKYVTIKDRRKEFQVQAEKGFIGYFS